MATSRMIAMRSAAVGSVCALRRMSRTSSRSCTATDGGACFTPTPTRHCSSCTNDRYPRTKGLATGLPRFSTQSLSSNFPTCSIMAHFSLDACPLSRDAAPPLFLLCPAGRHCTSLCDPTASSSKVSNKTSCRRNLEALSWSTRARTCLYEAPMASMIAPARCGFSRLISGYHSDWSNSFSAARRRLKKMVERG